MTFIAICALLISACGQKFPDYSPEQPQYEYYEGYFRGTFKSLNVRSVGQTDGYVVLRARHNQFYARISLKNHIPYIRHLQLIHKSNRCPDSRADRNRDGVIDFQESLAVTGMGLIPLDTDLASRRGGFENFPLTNGSGQYLYSASASTGRLLQDLRGYSRIPTVYIDRLEYGESLDLEKRVVMVYGDGKNDLLPIACAELNFDNDLD